MGKLYLFNLSSFLLTGLCVQLVCCMFSEVAADSGLSSRLTQIYAELESMEADKAPAKAGVILCGLGFSASQQRRPTR